MPDENEGPVTAATPAALEKIEAGTPLSGTPAEVTLPVGVSPSPNYLAAIEVGTVLAASGLYLDVRDPAKAAVKVMIGMDLGVSPTAAMQGIQTFEERGKTVFLIEGKLLAAVVKRRPDVDYAIVKRSPEKVEIKFSRLIEGKWKKQEPNIVWTIEHARQAVPKFANKDTWKNIPEVMLTWRALAEGIRLHFPDVIAGQPIYLDDEIAGAETGKMREALEPPRQQALTDTRADQQREKMRAIFDVLKAINPDRLLPAMFDRMMKGAEHSHDRLDNMIEQLEDLRDTERTLAGLKDAVSEKLPKPEAKALIDSAERQPSNRQRIEALEKGLGGAEGDGKAAPDA